MASARCSGLVAPTIGAVTAGRLASQARAIWARGTPRLSATLDTCSAISRSSAA